MKDPVVFFAEAEKFVRGNGFQAEIDWCDNRQPFDSCSETQFLGAYAWVVLNTGFRHSVVQAKWQPFVTAFRDFNVDVILADREKVFCDAISIFHNTRKVRAIIETVSKLRPFSAFKQQIKANPLETLQTLPFIGNVTKYHLARDLGFDFVKPDRHLMRLATKFGMDPFGLCDLIHQKTGRRLGTIDLILWRYCEQGGQMRL